MSAGRAHMVFTLSCTSGSRQDYSRSVCGDELHHHRCCGVVIKSTGAHADPHLVTQRPLVRQLADVSARSTSPPVMLGPVDLIATPGTIGRREFRLNRGKTGLSDPSPTSTTGRVIARLVVTPLDRRVRSSGHVVPCFTSHELVSSSAHSMEYDGRSTHVFGSGGPGNHAEREFPLP